MTEASDIDCQYGAFTAAASVIASRAVIDTVIH
jgi:hypothetical protein